MFKTTENEGFQMTFANGWTVSVQFGPGNYCDRRASDFDAPRSVDIWQARTAEVAAWPADDERRLSFEDDEVRGHLTADQVMGFLQFVAALPEGPTDHVYVPW